MGEKTVAPHGTKERYGANCQCDDCKAAWAAYMRARRRANGQPSREESLVAREIEVGEQKIPQLVEQDEDAEVNVSLTPLDFQILVDLQRKLRCRRSEVIGQLLREFGPELSKVA